MTVTKLSTAQARAHLPALTEILHASVLAGASVNFCLPFSRLEAEVFWKDTAFPALDAGARTLWIAHHNGVPCGTVMLHTAMSPNQPHRGEVTKLLVHPTARRAGIARALMVALEAEARAMGKSLLTLDTWSGSPAEALYRRLGYAETGQVPNFFVHPTDGSLQPTTYFHKLLT